MSGISENVSETATLIEKLTQLLTLQQNQLITMQQTSQTPTPPPQPNHSETTLHPNIVPIKLDGKNYSLWSQAVRMYLKAREKLKHITDSPPTATDPLFNRWDIEDTVVKGWICNSLDTNLYGKFLRYPTAKEVWDAIATTFYDGSDTTQVFELNKRVNKIKQEGRPVEEYYNELQDIWLEIDFRHPNPMVCAIDIEKFDKCTQESRVYSFLDGLDDKLDNERANVLQMTPFPTLEQAFVRVRKEATRQEIMRKGYEGEVQSSVAMVSKGQRNFETNYNSNKFSPYVDKSGLKCTYCGQTRHTKDQCFQLVGYPDWYKDKRKGKHTGQGRGRVAVAQADGGPQQLKNNGMNSMQLGAQPSQWSDATNQGAAGARTQTAPSSSSEPTGPQAKGLHAVGHGSNSFFPTTGKTDDSAETGNSNVVYNLSKREEWVLDSGATDHMTNSEMDLINTRYPEKSGIFNANGICYPVSGAGDVDIHTKEILGRGTKRGGLYYLDNEKTGNSLISVDSTEQEKIIWLWHKRLGHPSFGSECDPHHLMEIHPNPDAEQSNSASNSEPPTEMTEALENCDTTEGVIQSEDVPHRPESLGNNPEVSSLTTRFKLPPRSNRGQPPKRYVPEDVVVPEKIEETEKDPKWVNAMNVEMEALIKNETWEITNLPVGKKPVGCKWVYTVKYDAKGKIERYKARLVAKGYTQTYGIDFQETFSPVAKLNSVRVILSLAANLDWPLHQFDVKNTFLHGELEEEIYMEIPPGYQTPTDTNKVCRLKKALYGLKQSPRAWFGRFCRAMKGYGYTQSDSDHTMFFKKNQGKIAVLIIYVDDMIITGDDKIEIQNLEDKLSKEFEMKNLGGLKYFLGIEVSRNKEGIYLSQRKYILDLLTEVGMLECKPVDTPTVPNLKLNAYSDHTPTNIERYQRLVGKLIYLSHTRPDIAYAVSIISQFMHSPKEEHLEAVMRIIRYLKGTAGRGIVFRKNSHLQVMAYSDADWAGCVMDRKSTAGYFTFLGGNLVTWKSKKQNVVTLSSAKSEYRGMVKAICELLWLKKFLTELGFEPQSEMRLLCDNKAAIDIAHNPVQHDRTKHVEVDRHFIKEKLDAKIISLPFVRSNQQLADVLTKPVSYKIFNDSIERLGMIDIYAPT
ncbi:uncharacterized protein LOC144560258 [Carex rostrata]